MVQKRATISKESVAQQRCCHYWIIESAAGPASKGVCKFCGAQKEFKNYLLDCLEEDEEKYQEWLRRQRYDKKEKKPDEHILSRLGGVDRDAAN